MTMSSPSSNSKKDSAAFFLLDKRIQHWIWQAGWTEFRDIQESSIPLIVEGKQDVIIASATASGKTEAAFFPILTRLLAQQERKTSVIYISPLKALINDQWARLEQLCDLLKIQVIPWHGDISEARKTRFLKEPNGCLLITPESLEGLLIRYGHSLSSIFSGLQYIVVDELHAFVDTERGKQLQSLMNRIEVALGRRFPRIGLSATLGEMRAAAEFLRPGRRHLVCIIESKESGQELKVIVKGYYDRFPSQTQTGPQLSGGSDDWERGPKSITEGAISISKDIFTSLRGSNNLIFPNSRAKVEIYSDFLRRLCEDLGLPNEFWPHHGSLSKEIREETERAVKAGDIPATAISTSTLELGIDIGAVKSVAQIGPAPSVASLRQRLGRSGRRKGEAAILRCYCLEDEINPDTPFSDQLRESLVQTIAQICLLLKGWYEPPRTVNLHLSTLIQQLLSLIVQYGGLNAADAWKILFLNGVFSGLEKGEFAELLHLLGSKEILIQDSRGLLLLGSIGERIVNHFSFLAAFSSPDEFRVIHKSKTLGSLPLSRPVVEGSYIIFAGKRWRVLSCRPQDKTIEVETARGGKPPMFDGMGGKVHDHVRKEMRSILSEATPICFLDIIATRQLEEARHAYAHLELDRNTFLESGNDVAVFTWLGDWVNDTLVLMLMHHNLRASNEGILLRVHNTNLNEVLNAFKRIGDEQPLKAERLAFSVQNKLIEKWDHLLTEELLRKTFASRELDMNGAGMFVSAIVQSTRGRL
jgi:ATP-dependent Lhr-like helicase